ncbi:MULTISPECIES: DUF1822 family protein [unclassified Moorena]|uniref:DUF1822 family protein n=3 Tax=Moorena TaxID=1155738 RepID=UPI0013B7A6AB|nr:MULTISPECIES: DUF1822 family protein [unclassified Moorena]NER92112.1 DUF1822 family protein [Moorena sp. SIO3A2]NET68174.1 DUF1822 family protein [Moorena sp. SIO1G6]
MTTQNMENLEITLGIEAHRFASKFAAEQATTAKSKQVYFNTLAVYAVHRYLKYLGIDTDLNESDCWNPILRHQWNVADLVVPDIGRLECRPVLPGETTVSLPPEVTEDRIGYLAIQFSEHLDQVQLLGFAKTVVADVIEVSRLRSVDDLIGELSPLPVVNPLKLKDLEKLFDDTWQAVDAVLAPRQFAFRNLEINDDVIERAKKITLGLSADSQQVDLVVSQWLAENQEVGFLFQVHPTEKNEFLPLGLKLKVMLESDSEEVEAQEADSWIQIALTELPGKLVTVQIYLNDESVTEEFVA